ncbi:MULTISPECIES: hypothetical protein [unclassified Oceanobacillus]|uniref:hypothetical protein n=1 Tax=unclassified Oceanobacillus TaxID=2630292 RepID=UPI001BE531BA|nr:MULTISPECIES: hypothetical protein [unclassified Oceanobacillus]MBT2601248.1 hypothetical protein [Oceanobacillus sp. ISL-74]MBT2653646.1 hypothetical protein [Oceanobacillus sp. ISL-73]
MPDAYNMIIKLGRLIKNDGFQVKKNPQGVFNYFSLLSDLMEGRSVEEFFTVFPPIKDYEDHGSWNYQSTIELKQELGEKFTRESFQSLLMSHCYESKYLLPLGIAFMNCISLLHETRTGRSVMEDWAINNEIAVYENRNNELLPKLYRIK